MPGRDWRDAHFSQQPIGPKRIAEPTPQPGAPILQLSLVGFVLVMAVVLSLDWFRVVDLGIFHPPDASVAATPEPQPQTFDLPQSDHPAPTIVVSNAAPVLVSARVAKPAPSPADQQRAQMLDRLVQSLARNREQEQVIVDQVNAMLAEAARLKSEHGFRDQAAYWANRQPTTAAERDAKRVAQKNLEAYLASRELQLARRANALKTIASLNGRIAAAEQDLAALTP